MKYISPLVSDARNKLGGSVFARNRSGVYARARVTPVQPRTAFQQANRAQFAALASGWRALTQSQRTTWNTYAAGITLHDTLGAAYKPSGMQAFISHSRNALLVGGTQVNNAPVGAPAENGIAITSFTAANLGAGNMDLSIAVASDTFSSPHMLLFAATPGLSPGISFVGKSVYRTFSYQPNDGGPFDFNSEYTSVFGPAATGSMIAIRVRQVNSNNGLSTIWQTMQAIVS